MPRAKKQKTGKDSSAEMPRAKKQKTGKDSSGTTREDDVTPASPESDGPDYLKRDVEKIPPYEYVCIQRPYYDWEAERRAAPDDAEEDDEDEERSAFAKLMKEEQASGKIFQPAAEHKDWKWVMLWGGWKKYCDLEQTIAFCDPDNFGMYIYNDWKAYGVVEAVENYLVAFDKVMKKPGDENWLFQAWAFVSAIGIWLNDKVDGGMVLTMIDDGERAGELNALVGCALLTALAAIDVADELKPDSKFLDLPLVISSFLQWSDGLESYGIEGDDTFWRRHLVEYYTQASLDPAKGVFDTVRLLEELKEDDNEDEDEDTSGRSEKDPWAWNKRLRQYKRHHGKMGGSKHDIRKMSRRERAQYAFDKEDPFKDIPEKDIKEGNIGFA